MPAKTTSFLATAAIAALMLTGCGGTPSTPVDDNDPLVVEGKTLYQTTADGVGCASCHKADATGNPAVGAPDIRSATRQQIVDALGRVRMRSLSMTDEEIDAVAAYLATLARR